MRTEVQISQQVRDFVRSQPPENRHRLRLALRSLEKEQGDIRSLEGPLDGFFRLRIGSFRVIFTYATEHGSRQIRCLYAEKRSIVYELFSEELRRQFFGQKQKRVE